MRKLLTSILWFFNILAALALLIAYFAPFIDPSLLAFPAFFGLAFPLILFINLSFIIVWLFINWRYALLSFFLIVAGYSRVKTHIQLFGNKEKVENVQGIKVITYNVHTFGIRGTKNSKAVKDGIRNFLLKQKADIICLQEAGLKRNFKLKGYQTIGDKSNLLFTKLKVIKTGYLLDGNDYKYGVYADVLFENDTIRVFNVQLLSYSVSGDIEEYEKQPDKVNPKKKIVVIAQKLKKGFTLRVNETYKLRKSLEKSPYPVILCGDLNDPPASYTYREITGIGLKDAFVESGKGYGNTYNGYLPNMRIDYILASDNFKFYNYKVFKINLSDHFPVSALLVPDNTHQHKNSEK